MRRIFLVSFSVFSLAMLCFVKLHAMSDSIKNEHELPCSESYLKAKNHYVFCENISKEAIDRVIELDKIDTLTMTSRGGTSIQAIRLAEHLNDIKAKLILSEYCLSACAQFLMLGVEEVLVDDWTIIGFHHSSISLTARLAKRKLIENRIENIKKQYIQPEIDFYVENKIRSDWLWAPDVLLEPTCTNLSLFTIVPIEGKGPSVGYKSKYLFVVPSQDIIEELNPNIIFSPNAQTRSAIKKRTETEPLAAELLLFIEEFPFLDEKEFKALADLPLCEDLQGEEKEPASTE